MDQNDRIETLRGYVAEMRSLWNKNLQPKIEAGREREREAASPKVRNADALKQSALRTENPILTSTKHKAPMGHLMDFW